MLKYILLLNSLRASEVENLLELLTAKVTVFWCHIFGKRKTFFLALSPPPRRLCDSRRLFISKITKACLQESTWKGNKIETTQKRAPDCSIFKNLCICGKRATAAGDGALYWPGRGTATI